ncbi:hypothetical protein [Burkholderia ubonensis]|uniref:hypothetical protein n=1 Tax=Burkholderia ubonensis TaxID=101571 RepID=UPI0007542C3E|nr:hypothetical protein [Burkholderia ubonensis]KVO15140.1 hypothetical protein WJ74_10825 [Burkholderia ubonensis]KVT01135.1 hypothetical protein WK47_25000 [Burkholderia ubonensis]KVT07432.1 hypothetical protein WK46_10900 [Burkholderia ubonensis]KVT33791.1 hypothetical protein WK50_02385 [Burkholderia ubonensis]
MSHLIRFIERVRDSLTPDEWTFFSACYIERKSVADSAALVPAFAGDGEAVHQLVLRKLRTGEVQS